MGRAPVGLNRYRGPGAVDPAVSRMDREPDELQRPPSRGCLCDARSARVHEPVEGRRQGPPGCAATKNEDAVLRLLDPVPGAEGAAYNLMQLIGCGGQ